MSSSAFAGSSLLISLELLSEDGLLDEQLLKTTGFSEYRTNYQEVTAFKSKLLQLAFKQFDTTDSSFQQFKEETGWLRDYSLFMALKEEYRQTGWFSWPENLASRKQSALQEKEREHRERLEYFAFEQFLFFSQWKKLHETAKKNNIRLIGDIPIYVGWDSVDVWANQSLFELDSTSHRPTAVAGVPPDYFSKTGQRWGNPLYRWNSEDDLVRKKLYSWWTERFRSIFQMVDIARVDHFRGFESYWSIPASEKTAVNGKWVKGPGLDFFNEMQKSLGSLPIIAEDLGEITPEVIRLRDTLGFPGMKILQFAFDGNRDNAFLPYNFETPNSVIYTGTHDNDTTVGWYLDNKLSDKGRQEIKQFCNRKQFDGSEIHRDLIYLALSSTSRYAVFPIQDVLGFGNDCKMNSPGTQEGNWTWRCAPRFLNSEVSDWLRNQTELFGRCQRQDITQDDKKNRGSHA